MNTNTPIPIANKNFQRIVNFFLFECPVRTFRRKGKEEDEKRTEQQPHPKYNYTFSRVSARGRTFAERGLSGAALNTLRAAMRRVATDGFVLDSVESEIIIPTDDVEYLVVRKNEGNVSVTEGYFYCIRNAFAHGSFEVKGKTYIFENYSNGKVKGIGRLQESTLLLWIELADMSIEEMRKFGK